MKNGISWIEYFLPRSGRLFTCASLTSRILRAVLPENIFMPQLAEKERERPKATDVTSEICEQRAHAVLLENGTTEGINNGTPASILP